MIEYEKRLTNNLIRQAEASVKKQEIQIPIQIITSNSTAGYPTQQYSRPSSVKCLRNPNNEKTSNLIQKSNNYNVPSQPVYHDTKITNHSPSDCLNIGCKTEFDPYAMSKASSISRLSNDRRNDFSIYESALTKSYRYPNFKHRTSLFLDNFNDTSCSTKHSAYSTLYKSDQF